MIGGSLRHTSTGLKKQGSKVVGNSSRPVSPQGVVPNIGDVLQPKCVLQFIPTLKDKQGRDSRPTRLSWNAFKKDLSLASLLDSPHPNGFENAVRVLLTLRSETRIPQEDMAVVIKKAKKRIRLEFNPYNNNRRIKQLFSGQTSIVPFLSDSLIEACEELDFLFPKSVIQDSIFDCFIENQLRAFVLGRSNKYACEKLLELASPQIIDNVLSIGGGTSFVKRYVSSVTDLKSFFQCKRIPLDYRVERSDYVLRLSTKNNSVSYCKNPSIPIEIRQALLEQLGKSGSISQCQNLLVSLDPDHPGMPAFLREMSKRSWLCDSSESGLPIVEALEVFTKKDGMDADSQHLCFQIVRNISCGYDKKVSVSDHLILLSNLSNPTELISILKDEFQRCIYNDSRSSQALTSAITQMLDAIQSLEGSQKESLISLVMKAYTSAWQDRLSSSAKRKNSLSIMSKALQSLNRLTSSAKRKNSLSIMSKALQSLNDLQGCLHITIPQIKTPLEEVYHAIESGILDLLSEKPDYQTCSRLQQLVVSDKRLSQSADLKKACCVSYLEVLPPSIAKGSALDKMGYYLRLISSNKGYDTDELSALLLHKVRDELTDYVRANRGLSPEKSLPVYRELARHLEDIDPDSNQLLLDEIHRLEMIKVQEKQDLEFEKRLSRLAFNPEHIAHYCKQHKPPPIPVLLEVPNAFKCPVSLGITVRVANKKVIIPKDLESFETLKTSLETQKGAYKSIELSEKGNLEADVCYHHAIKVLFKSLVEDIEKSFGIEIFPSGLEDQGSFKGDNHVIGWSEIKSIFFKRLSQPKRAWGIEQDSSLQTQFLNQLLPKLQAIGYYFKAQLSDKNRDKEDMVSLASQLQSLMLVFRHCVAAQEEGVNAIYTTLVRRQSLSSSTTVTSQLIHGIAQYRMERFNAALLSLFQESAHESATVLAIYKSIPWIKETFGLPGDDDGISIASKRIADEDLVTIHYTKDSHGVYQLNKPFKQRLKYQFDSQYTLKGVVEMLHHSINTDPKCVTPIYTHLYASNLDSLVAREEKGDFVCSLFSSDFTQIKKEGAVVLLHLMGILKLDRATGNHFFKRETNGSPEPLQQLSNMLHKSSVISELHQVMIVYMQPMFKSSEDDIRAHLSTYFSPNYDTISVEGIHFFLQLLSYGSHVSAANQALLAISQPFTQFLKTVSDGTIADNDENPFPALCEYFNAFLRLEAPIQFNNRSICFI